jgi:8-oxo-dGTP pyrophosphatase MutT (NUDIX family)
MTTERRAKLAAYGVCRRDDQVLSARFVSHDGASKYWTLPGGKVEHAADRTTQWRARSRKRPATSVAPEGNRTLAAARAAFGLLHIA